MILLITCISAFAIALVLGRWVIPLLRALKAGQSIRQIGPSWHNTKQGTPTMGGVLFILASAFAVFADASAIRAGDYTILYVYFFALAFGVIGFADDFIKVCKKRNLGLTALQKSLMQLAVAAIYLYLLQRSGRLSFDLYIPFANVTVAVNRIVYLVFAMFVIVGCVNAVNLTDGVDGLATGVTMPVMLFFVLIATRWADAPVAKFAVALFGGLAAFLCYNFHPARVFMGDTGSLFLGGAVCGIAFALDMPLVLIPVGIVYICEAASDIIQVTYFKLTHGKRVFRMAPIHHHFEMGGWSEIKIFTVFTLVTVLGCALAWLGVMNRFCA
ncbi:MAG: phospho-N-acetylmuramoyl-pentapeptide-transferase [Oscillospiraceae bacterium]|nr:phospho-N-acetylmuramoyl-pentapeptide-transferase [Oscillospiraceae bacterium]